MKFTLHCFGTAGYHPNDQRHTSSYFLPEQGIALDAGSGFYRCFPKIQTPELHVFLSHAHLDHIVGLTFLWNAYRNRSLQQVYVHAEPPKIEALQSHLFSELIFPAIPNIVWKPITPGETTQVNGAHVTSFPLQHPGGSLGFLVESHGRQLAYVSDTTTDVDRDYWQIVQKADMLIHECNFGAKDAEFARQTGHSDLGNLLKGLQQHAIRRALLTHFNTIDDDLSDELKDLRKELGKSLKTDILLGHDGLVLDV